MVALALLLLSCSWARAQASSTGAATQVQDSPQARRFYERAAAAFSEARYSDAIDLFRQANQLSPRPELQFNIALAYEEMGDVPGALEAYRSYLRQAPKSADHADVEKHVARLEQHLKGLGIQQVTVLSEPAGATLLLDGRPVGVTPWTGELAAGRHQLVAQLRGFVDASMNISAPAEHATDIHFAMVAEVSERPRPSSTTALGPQRRTGISAIRPATWALLGVGAVSVVGATVLEVGRASSEDDAARASNPEQAVRDRDSAHDKQAASYVFLSVGAATLLLGGVFAYLDVKEAKAAGVNRVSLGCAGDGCAVQALGCF